MADLGLFDLLFAAIPKGIDNLTFVNFKRLWRYYGLSRMHACRLEAPPPNVDPSTPFNLAHEQVHPLAEDYRQHTQDIFRAVLERLLVVSTLEQRIWAIYMLYTCYMTQSPPPGLHHEPILVPQSAWSMLERCKSDFHRMRRISDPRRILSLLLTHNCLVCAVEPLVFPHSGLDYDVRGGPDHAPERRRALVFDLRSTPAHTSGSLRPLFVVADALDRTSLCPRPQEPAAVLQVKPSTRELSSLRRRGLAYEREVCSLLGERAAAALAEAVGGAGRAGAGGARAGSGAEQEEASSSTTTVTAEVAARSRIAQALVGPALPQEAAPAASPRTHAPPSAPAPLPAAVNELLVAVHAELELSLAAADLEQREEATTAAMHAVIDAFLRPLPPPIPSEASVARLEKNRLRVRARRAAHARAAAQKEGDVSEDSLFDHSDD